jgi:hypothetical protein
MIRNVAAGLAAFAMSLALTSCVGYVRDGGPRGVYISEGYYYGSYYDGEYYRYYDGRGYETRRYYYRAEPPPPSGGAPVTPVVTETVIVKPKLVPAGPRRITLTP